MRVSDYIADRLATHQLRHVFLVTGGGAMFLNDAVAYHPQLTTIFSHHEQASAMAAEAYARIAGKPAAVIVTTGPGGINALNGAFGAWTDSIPMLVISGQVKRATCLATTSVSALRQLGDQEAEIIRMVAPITKYANVVEKPEEIAWQLDKALHIATAGRPGPCWLDIPIDVQGAMIDPEKLARFVPDDDTRFAVDSAAIKAIIHKLTDAKRPAIVAGNGVRAANAVDEFEIVIRELGIPVTTAWAHDLLASDDPLSCGRPGTIGTRAGNFTVQNADLILVLGSRLNIRQVSYNWEAFAPNAFKIQVDIDPAELNKPTVRPDLGIVADLKPFLSALAVELKGSWTSSDEHRSWLGWCRERVEKYPAVQPRQREFNGKINAYHFIDRLICRLNHDDIIVCGNATACIVPFQTAQLKHGQRMFSNSGSASMGYDLPAATGAYYGAVALRGSQRRVICLAGDGSIMMNLQELQTIVHHQIPIKIFVLDNRGYLSIRTSQGNFFKRLAGEGPDTGVSFPDFVAVARAFGIPASKIAGPDFENEVESIISGEGPYLCQVVLDPHQQFEPRMSSRQLEDGRIVSAPLEDMFPFLDRDELAGNMLDK